MLMDGISSHTLQISYSKLQPSTVNWTVLENKVLRRIHVPKR